MADNTNTDEPKKVNDISKPGETPASATSRPVIVKHRAVMKDPMVTPPNPSQLKDEDTSDSSSDATTSKEEAVSRKAPELKPSEESIEQAKSDSKASNETNSSDNDGTEAENKNSSNAQSLATAAVDVLANQAVKKKEDGKGDTKKQEVIAKHIEEKTYFAPIGQISKRKAKIHTIVALFILVALFGCYLAVDAGMILPDTELPFEIIK